VISDLLALASLLLLLVVVCVREYIHHKRSRGE
jgi:hypothetical protein